MSTIKKGLITKPGVIMLVCLTLAGVGIVVYVNASFQRTAREMAADELRWRNDAQAQLTAESGLMYATSLFKSGNLSVPVKIDLDGSEVTIEATPEGADSGFVRILSTVRHPGIAYDKRVEWQVRVDTDSASSGVAVGGGQTKRAWREADVPRS